MCANDLTFSLQHQTGNNPFLYMENDLQIRFADTDDINTIGYLAQQIWPVAYKEIISKDQISYMLNLFYAPASLRKQIQVDKHQFLIAELDETPVGFAAYSKTEYPGVYKLHKLYVDTNIHGKGIGKALVDFIIEELKKKNATALRLNVNRQNKAAGFYEKLGFTIIGEMDLDIGNGFFMIDYVMELKIPSP